MKTPNIEKKSLRAMMAIVAIGAVLLAAILFTGKSGGAPEGTDTETSAKADEKEKGVGGGAGKAAMAENCLSKGRLPLKSSLQKRREKLAIAYGSTKMANPSRRLPPLRPSKSNALTAR